MHYRDLTFRRLASPGLMISRFLAVIAAATACATGTSARTSLDLSAKPDYLEVNNYSFADLRVYAVLNDASHFPLGTVQSLSSRRVAIPGPLVDARKFRLVAAPLGLGNHHSVEVMIHRGDTLVWNLENDVVFSRLITR